MAESTIWWVLAGSIVAVELLTGTFYLLMISFGFVAAALAAHAGASITIQFVVAAIFGGGFVVAWRRYRRSQPTEPPASANPDVNLDIGEVLQVDEWLPDRTSKVKYRGAIWSVALSESSAEPTRGQYRVIEVVGSRLIVKRV
jgi:membrane protein implicated in regulation of membrane protease activity